ncbi:MAG: hypothetical protein NUV81_03155 [bacterium]|nr:hypothetical protein [bacterium]
MCFTRPEAMKQIGSLKNIHVLQTELCLDVVIRAIHQKDFETARFFAKVYRWICELEGVRDPFVALSLVALSSDHAHDYDVLLEITNAIPVISFCLTLTMTVLASQLIDDSFDSNEIKERAQGAWHLAISEFSHRPKIERVELFARIRYETASFCDVQDEFISQMMTTFAIHGIHAGGIVSTND